MKYNRYRLLPLVENAISDSEIFIEKYYNGHREALVPTQKVLYLLKEEIKEDKDISIRVLRAMHDVSALAVKEYENTDLEKSILQLVKGLMEEFPIYATLDTLSGDFGKGDPI